MTAMPTPEASRQTGAPLAARAAGLTEILLAAGFGGGAIWTLNHLAANGELPMTPWGFRSMSGPFEQLGQESFTVLGWALVAVCALDVLAGTWLLQLRRRGLRLGVLTAAPQLALGVGFALPFLLIGVPVRVILAFVGRRSLR